MNLTYLRDLGERAAGTLLATAAAVVIESAASGVSGVDWLHVLNVAGLATILTVLKGGAAHFLGDPNSAGLLPTPK